MGPGPVDQLLRHLREAEELIREAQKLIRASKPDQLGIIQTEPGWSSAAAAEHLGVSKSHVCRLAAQGLLAAQKWGLTWRFDPESVAAYAALERRPGPKVAGERISERRS